MTDSHPVVPSIVMVADLSRQATDPSTRAATIGPADLPALAEVMAVAYEGTVHDVGHTPAQALDYIRQHTAGDIVGPMLWDCSFQSLADNRPVAVVFTSLEEADLPLFFDIYTHPEYRGKGFATALIRHAMSVLLDRGYKRVRLRVALANENARRLYERLGFAPE